MGILCVFCVYDTIGNRCFEKTSFPKMSCVRRIMRGSGNFRQERMCVCGGGCSRSICYKKALATFFFFSI